MTRRDQELLDRQLRGLCIPQRRDGTMILAIVAIFLAGIFLGTYDDDLISSTRSTFKINGLLRHSGADVCTQRRLGVTPGVTENQLRRLSTSVVNPVAPNGGRESETDMDTNSPDLCKYCFGTGYEPSMKPVKWGRPIDPPTPCPRCSGTGRKLKPVPIISKAVRARRIRRGG